MAFGKRAHQSDGPARMPRSNRSARGWLAYPAAILAVALNYGSQHEIARAATKAAAEGDITAQSIERHLDTAPLPPLDLLIRTSGEVRLSNFLLWQCAYAEMWFTAVLWPDFTLEHLRQALDEFGGRERRYGGR